MTAQADTPLVAELLASPNHDLRAEGASVEILLLHYTGMASAQAAIDRLRDPVAKVSSHYVVTEEGKIVQLVPEHLRARHAGVSCWEDISDVNSHSIGIEIVNPGHNFGYPEFPAPQVDAVIALCRDIIGRHRIRADRVLAHSDVAPLRKQDPGEKFPWHRLHEAGVGLWVPPEPLADAVDGIAHILSLQRDLQRYGYGVDLTGRTDELLVAVVTAFQRHFRPALVNGVADASTVATLRRLLSRRDAEQRRQPHV